jgi:hypothetical protein
MTPFYAKMTIIMGCRIPKRPSNCMVKCRCELVLMCDLSYSSLLMLTMPTIRPWHSRASHILVCSDGTGYELVSLSLHSGLKIPAELLSPKDVIVVFVWGPWLGRANAQASI